MGVYINVKYLQGMIFCACEQRFIPFLQLLGSSHRRSIKSRGRETLENAIKPSLKWTGKKPESMYVTWAVHSYGSYR